MADAAYSNPQLEQVLREAPVSDEVRAKAWNAFVTTDDPKKFYETFNGMKELSPEVKTSLRSLKFPEARRATQPPVAGSEPASSGQKGPKDQPWYQRAIVPLHKMIGEPKPDQSKPEQFARGLGHGLLSGVEQMTTPENVGLMGGMAGASAIPVVGQILDIGAGVVFSYEMAKDLVESIPEAAEAWKKGDTGKLGQIVGSDVVEALALKKSGEHVRGKFKGAPDTKVAGGTRTSGTNARGAAGDSFEQWRAKHFTYSSASGWNDKFGNTYTGERMRDMHQNGETPDSLFGVGRRASGAAVSTEVRPEPGVHGHAAEPGQRPDYTHVSGEAEPQYRPDYSSRQPLLSGPLPPGQSPGPAGMGPWDMARSEPVQAPLQIASGPGTPQAGGKAGPSPLELLQTWQSGITRGADPVPPVAGLPPSRQLAEPELKLLTPEKSLEENIEIARTMPREVLSDTLLKMREASAKYAIKLLAASKKDPAKAAQLKAWAESAKQQIEAFQGILDAPPPGSGAKGSAKPSSGPTAAKASAPAKAPGAAKLAAKPAAKPKTPEAVSDRGKKIKEQVATTGETKPAAAESNTGQEKPAAPEINAGNEFAAGVEPGIRRVFETAKAHGMREIQLTIPRIGNKAPIKIGINMEFDSPEDIIARIQKFAHEIGGLIQVDPMGAPGGLKWAINLQAPQAAQ